MPRQSEQRNIHVTIMLSDQEEKTFHVHEIESWWSSSEEEKPADYPLKHDNKRFASGPEESFFDYIWLRVCFVWKVESQRRVSSMIFC